MKLSSRSPSVFPLLLGVAILAAYSPPVSGQQEQIRLDRTPSGYQITRTLPGGGKVTSNIPSPSQALDRFAENAGKAGPQGVGGDGTLSTYLIHHERFPRVAVDSVLDGLERLALSANDHRVRTAAASTIAGTGDPRLTKAIPEALSRSLRVYRQSRDPLVRAVIMPRLAFYEARPQVVAFLKSVATQGSREEDFPDAPAHAVTALSYMGEMGSDALRQLHESGKVQNPKAGAFLHYLSQRGFQ